MSDEVARYWNSIIGTLDQRSLLKERPREGGLIVPEADAYLLHDRAVFILDMQRLGGIPRETWLDERLWRQFRAALGGRRVFISDSSGLAITVSREPHLALNKRLPAVIPLSDEHLPDKPYHVCFGYSRHGAVVLDLAGKHRAILIGGTSGGGKTNLMQSILLQLAAKHPAGECQFAIVDTKEVDFGADYVSLPHMFADIAHTLDEADRLIEQVEAERVRRQALMAKAGVANWRDYQGSELLPMLVLVVDEAADFSGRPAMGTLIEVARKGRAFGISVIVGTQHPSSKVIDPQVKANLPTAIAFQMRTDVESRVVLGVSGAEKLNRPGMALAFVDGRWETVQTLLVEKNAAHKFVAERVHVELSVLSEIEVKLVRMAVDELDSEFKIAPLYGRCRGQISKRKLTKLAQTWEDRGWLTHPVDSASSRHVTDELLSLLPTPTQGAKTGDTMIGVTGGDREPETVTGTVTG